MDGYVRTPSLAFVLARRYAQVCESVRPGGGVVRVTDVSEAEPSQPLTPELQHDARWISAHRSVLTGGVTCQPRGVS